MQQTERFDNGLARHVLERGELRRGDERVCVRGTRVDKFRLWQHVAHSFRRVLFRIVRQGVLPAHDAQVHDPGARFDPGSRHYHAVLGLLHHRKRGSFVPA